MVGFTPDKDTGWGLIFRLNDLWSKADREALAGKYDIWELTLDRIFCNLLYRNEMDDNGTELKLQNKDSHNWGIIKNKIKLAKRDMMVARRSKRSSLLSLSRVKLYEALTLYDIWLRKLMHQENRLYLKEIESNPSMALFGDSFRKKGR